MGYLIHVVLALATLLFEEDFLPLVSDSWISGGDAPRGGVALAGFLALSVVPSLLARATTGAFGRGKFSLSAFLGNALHRSPPVLFLIIVLLFRWTDAVEGWTGQSASFTDWPEPALLLALFPFVAFQLLAIDARVRLKDSRAEHRAQERSFQSRLFFSALVPFLIYLAVVLIVGWEPGVRARIDGVDSWRVAFSACVLGLFVLCMPSILRNTWRTDPLTPGPQREMLENLAARAGFRCRDLLIWHTGHRMANAAVVGMTPRTRVVLLSDSLLSMLPSRELGAVFAHEIAHALRHHVIIFLLWTLAFFMGAELAVTWVSEWAHAQASAPLWLGAGLVLVLALGWYLGFGWLSRRFELEADLTGVELTNDPAALVSALELVGGRYREAGGWRHFSTAERVAFVERAHWDPGLGQRLQRTLRRWAIALSVLVLALGSLKLVDLSGSYSWQMARVELEEGRPAQALRRLKSADEGAGWLGELAAVDLSAADHGGGLEGLGLEALGAGDGSRAELALELLVMRGRDDLDAVLRALREARGEADEGSGADGGTSALPSAWARALDEHMGEGRGAERDLKLPTHIK